MDSNRRTALSAGLLFIIATLTSVVGTQLSQAVLSEHDYLTRIAANGNLVTAGALLELIAAAACAGIAISLFPVLRKWSVGMALGSVVFRTIEAILYTVGVVSLLLVLALSHQFATAAASERGWLQAIADSWLAVRQQAIVPAVLAFSLGALLYYVLFYRSRLIPRWLSGWGIAAIIMAFAACLVAWFSQNALVSYTIVLLPIAVQEMVLALWLIFKGFNPSALRAGDARERSASIVDSLTPTRAGASAAS